MKFISDLLLLFRRNVLLTLRNPVWLFIGLFQPILYLLCYRVKHRQH